MLGGTELLLPELVEEYELVKFGLMWTLELTLEGMENIGLI